LTSSFSCDIFTSGFQLTKIEENGEELVLSQKGNSYPFKARENCQNVNHRPFLPFAIFILFL